MSKFLVSADGFWVHEDDAADLSSSDFAVLELEDSLSDSEIEAAILAFVEDSAARFSKILEAI